MKRILVPVDFSKYSEYALKVAASIAKLENAEIVVVHMLGLSDSIFTKSETDEVFDVIQYMQLTHKKFETFLDRDFLKGIEVHVTVRNYRRFYELNEVAEEWQADLIVMGSHGLSGIGDVFVGSNTEKVIRTANVPVLIIKNELKDFNIKNAVFVTDFNLDSVQPYKDIRRFLKIFNCEPQLLFVNLPQKFLSTPEILARSSQFLQNSEIENPQIFNKVEVVNDYTLEGGIFHYTAEKDIDLFIVPTHGRRGLAHFFYGSAGENIANTSEVSVLTIKIPA